MSHADVLHILAHPDARDLARALRAAHEIDEASAKAILLHFAGRTAKGVAWSTDLDESEATLLLGHLRARAGEV